MQNSTFHDDVDDGDDAESAVGSMEDTGSSSGNKGSNTDANEPDKQTVRYGSRMVYVVLAIAALAFGGATYFLLAKAVDDEFRSEFASYARELAELAGSSAENTFGQMRSLATAVTSVGTEEDTVMSFPNVSIAHWDLRVQEIADLTDAEMFFFIPFVEAKNRTGFEHFLVQEQVWLEEDFASRGIDASHIEPIPEHVYPVPEELLVNDTRRGYVNEGFFMEEILESYGWDSVNFSVPMAQYGPGTKDSSLTMMDLYTHQVFKKEFISSLEYDVPVISEAMDLQFLLDFVEIGNTTKNDGRLRSFTLHEVKQDFLPVSKTVGFVGGVVPWDTFFSGNLPKSVDGVVVVVASDCGSTMTFVVSGGANSMWQDIGDWHDTKYDDMMLQSRFFWKDHPKGTSRHCHFDLKIYPSNAFQNSYSKREAILYAVITASIFLFTAFIFFLYDLYILQGQQKLAAQAARAEAVVQSLFPKEVGNRLMEEADKHKMGSTHCTSKAKLRNFVMKNVDEDLGKSKPIADLFEESTILFADIVGFTAWSSTREPTQVFTLLETLYESFDRVAKKRRIFKVETVGDCYVAACGVPEPNPLHVVSMCRFAADVVAEMKQRTRELEIELGPDTADLGLRVGIHSGSVTAGVLRGERARFQLFGDTMNTTARIESTGQKNRVHLSKEAAHLLKLAGKSTWISKREDKVMAKGKGELETYWLNLSCCGRASESTHSGETSSTGDLSPSENNLLGGENLHSATGPDEKNGRLIDWNVETLATYLKEIERHRRRRTRRSSSTEFDTHRFAGLPSAKDTFSEVVEVIHLPDYSNQVVPPQDREKDIKLNEDVMSQLRSYVGAIASMYHDNPFHSFEHASHVTLSVTKLLSRIVAPDLDLSTNDAQTFHNHSYGIASDPLTQFAVVLSAVIHDCDHSGVPNSQLIAENDHLAAFYRNKSVAECNSIDLAWELLMDDDFQALRGAIYSSEEEFHRFRQLVVNTVLATDIMDKDLKALRNDRWDKAFTESSQERNIKDIQDRRATIVIEHLIQASDVSHTMQHWHVYRKWNSRLFLEMYKAYVEGRATKDPSTFWFEGEKGFFDFYILPLAKKLKECGIFGVSSAEYLQYAQQNRQEWEQRGPEVVAELICEAQAKFGIKK